MMSEDRKCPLCGSFYGLSDTQCYHCGLPQGELWDRASVLQKERDKANIACKFAHGAIIDAIGCEDGLDAADGEAVMEMLEDAVPSLRQLRPSGGPVV